MILAFPACAARSTPQPVTGPQPGHPDLHCPPGTTPAGFPPPEGYAVWCELTRADGKVVREGPSITFHPGGAKDAVGSYAADRPEGEWITYYPTGTPKDQGSYVQGRKEGTWVTFAPAGEKISEGSFSAGLEQGPWTFWSTETLSRAEGAYVLGERDGTWVDYSPEGKPVRERIYRGGRLVSQREL